MKTNYIGTTTTTTTTSLKSSFKGSITETKIHKHKDTQTQRNNIAAGKKTVSRCGTDKPYSL